MAVLSSAVMSGEPPKRSVIGDAVRTLRVKRSLTQQQLADRAGVSMSWVARVETGEILSPHPGTVEKIAEALGVTPADIDPDALGIIVSAAAKTPEQRAAVRELLSLSAEELSLAREVIAKMRGRKKKGPQR